jgi:hypothetical protein
MNIHVYRELRNRNRWYNLRWIGDNKMMILFINKKIMKWMPNSWIINIHNYWTIYVVLILIIVQ